MPSDAVNHVTILAALMLAAPHAAAATPTDDAPPFTIDTPWTIRIEPVLWYPGLRGDISFPGGGTSADNTFEVDEIDLDENEVTPAFRAEVRWDAWSLRFGGFVFNADDTGRATKAVEAGGLAIPRNAAVNYDLTYTSFETALGYRVLNRSLGDDPDDTTFHFDVYGGLRYYGIDLDLDTAAGTASGDGDWVEPIAGVRFELLFSRALSMELNSDFGLWDAGDNESSSWNIEVGFRWAMHDNVDVRLGFRHLSVDLTDGSGSDAFIFDNSLAGLTLSVGIRF